MLEKVWKTKSDLFSKISLKFAGWNSDSYLDSFIVQWIWKQKWSQLNHENNHLINVCGEWLSFVNKLRVFQSKFAPNLLRSFRWSVNQCFIRQIFSDILTKRLENKKLKCIHTLAINVPMMYFSWPELVKRFQHNLTT